MCFLMHLLHTVRGGLIETRHHIFGDPPQINIKLFISYSFIPYCFIFSIYYSKWTELIYNSQICVLCLPTVYTQCKLIHNGLRKMANKTIYSQREIIQNKSYMSHVIITESQAQFYSLDVASETPINCIKDTPTWLRCGL